MKKILVTLSLVFVFLFITQVSANAQAPFYGCAWQDSPVTSCVLYNLKDNCSSVPGYHSGTACSAYTASGKTACEAASNLCDKDPVGTTYKCSAAGSGKCVPCAPNETCTFTDPVACGNDAACKNAPANGGNPAEGTTSQVNFTGACATGSGANDGIQTAIGCIPIGSGEAIATFFIKWGIGIGGGIAGILIVYAGFLIMTSQGDPKRLQGGRELMTSAVSGVILIIFSIFVLRLLSVNILGFF